MVRDHSHATMPKGWVRFWVRLDCLLVEANKIKACRILAKFQKTLESPISHHKNK